MNRSDSAAAVSRRELFVGGGAVLTAAAATLHLSGAASLFGLRSESFTRPHLESNLGERFTAISSVGKRTVLELDAIDDLTHGIAGHLDQFSARFRHISGDVLSFDTHVFRSEVFGSIPLFISPPADPVTGRYEAIVNRKAAGDHG